MPRQIITSNTVRRIFGAFAENKTLLPKPGSVAAGLAGDDITAGNTIDILGKTAARELSFYKNNMNVSIRRFIEEMSKLDNISTDGEPKLSLVTPSELYDEYVAKGGVEKIIIRRFDDMAVSLHPIFRYDDLDISSDSNSVVNAAQKVILKAPRKEINAVWRDFFMAGADEYLKAVKYPTLTNVPYERIELALAMATVMLATDNISALTTSTKGMGFIQYVEIMKNIVLKNMNSIFDQYMNGIPAGIVIMATGEDHVVINDKVFNTFITEGGDIEVIFGAFVSGSNRVSINELKTNSVDLTNAWQDHLANSIAKRTALAAISYRANYIRVAEIIYDKNTATKMKTLLDTYSDNKVLNIPDTCMDLALDTKYANTNGRYFIERMGHYTSKSIERNKAAGLAYIDLLCNFIAKQITVI